MSLTDRIAAQLVTPVFIMTLAAGKIELTFAQKEIVFSGVVVFPGLAIDRHRHWLSLCQVGEVGCQAQQIVTFIFQGC